MNIRLYTILNIFIATVWFANGLLCKIMNLVPRHEAIVSNILAIESPRMLTCLIGIAEVVMAMWILSGYKIKLNAVTQMIVIAIMNLLEFSMVPELLMWGKLNALFALLFILLIGYNTFVLNTRTRKSILR